MPHLVYILYSPSKDIYYKGYSIDPAVRLLEHNSSESRFTRDKGPWILVYVKEFSDKRQALIEERRLKRLNRLSIERIIKETLPF